MLDASLQAPGQPLAFLAHSSFQLPGPLEGPGVWPMAPVTVMTCGPPLPLAECFSVPALGRTELALKLQPLS